MRFRFYLLLFALSLIITLLCAVWQVVPGYMDAEYYYATGLQIINGKGFTEPFLWNYLDGLFEIPHPSHTYWMPLSSLLSALGMWITQSDNYFSGRLIFIIINACIAPLTAAFTYRYSKSKSMFWIGGLLAVFPGMFVIYTSITDTFIPVMLLGGIIFWLVGDSRWTQFTCRRRYAVSSLLGILTGMMHLLRADGIVWAAVILFWLLYSNLTTNQSNNKKIRIAIIQSSFYCLGYAIIMFAWFTRNYEIFGSLFPPGSSRMLWLTEYNQIFTYQVESINFRNWYDAGILHHVNAIISALKSNLANFVAVQGSIFLLPLSIIGIFSNRRKSEVGLSVLIWMIILVLMTIVFPYAGSRGAYLHSASSLQIMLWAMAPLGLMRILQQAERSRKWKPDKAIVGFGIMILCLQLGLSIWFYSTRVIGNRFQNPIWSTSFTAAEELGAWIYQLGFKSTSVGLVNNPPGYLLATGLSSAVIPGGDMDEVLLAAKSVSAEYLILEKNQVNLSDLYSNPGDIGELIFLGEFNEVHIYAIK